MTKNKKFMIAVLLLAAAAVLAGVKLFMDRQPVIAPTDETAIETNQEIAAEVPEFSVAATQSGELVSDLLNANYEIETVDYGDAGEFVTGIDGIMADNQHFWAFYVNGEFATAGISQTKLEAGDIAEFKYEEIKPFEVTE